MTQISPTIKKVNPPTLPSVLESHKRDVQKSVNKARVGSIIAFYPGDATHAPTADVQIAQKQVAAVSPTGVQTLQDFPPLRGVPVFFPHGGGYTLTFPVSPGDECLLIFNDRELDNWLLSGPGLAPTTGRVHDLSDAMCLVGLRSNPNALAGISTSSCQLRSDDGTTYVEIAADQIVNVVGTLRVTGDIIAGYGGQNISVINHLHSDGGGIGDSGPPVNDT